MAEIFNILSFDGKTKKKEEDENDLKRFLLVHLGTIRITLFT